MLSRQSRSFLAPMTMLLLEFHGCSVAISIILDVERWEQISPPHALGGLQFGKVILKKPGLEDDVPFPGVYSPVPC